MMELVNSSLASLGITMADAPTIGAVVIFVVTILVAKAVQILADRAAFVASKWSGLEIRHPLFAIVSRPLWITVLLFGVLVEVQWIMPSAFTDFVVAGSAKTVMALIWSLALARTLQLVCSRLVTAFPQASDIFRLAENVGVALIAVMGVLLMLSVWNVSLTPFLASAGIAGVVIALASKDTLANFFGGVNVFLDRPFKTGDYIVLSSGERGEVVHIGLRSTRIQTRDDVMITIPNSEIANTKIINESAPSPRMRVRIKVSVSYGSDIDQVEEILIGVARKNALVSPEREPRVRFRTFEDFALAFELLVWTPNPADKGKLIHELNRAIFKEFNRVGIVIPIPQRDVYLHQVAGQVNTRPGSGEPDRAIPEP